MKYNDLIGKKKKRIKIKKIEQLNGKKTKLPAKYECLKKKQRKLTIKQKLVEKKKNI